MNAQQKSSPPITFTPGPWDVIPSTEHHGPYVTTRWGNTVCDCYCMSNPMAASVRNGGTSYPINHMAEQADANARLIAAAPDLLEVLKLAIEFDAWRVTAKDNRCMPTAREVNVRWSAIKAMGRQAIAKAISQ